MRFGPKVQLGSGWHFMEGFVNVDKYVGHRTWGFDVQADAGEYMEAVPGGTVDELVSNHLIEHLHKERAERLMHACFRALRSGGTVLIQCPDLLASCKSFVADELGTDMNDVFGAHRYEGDSHLWGYSQATLRRLVEKVGLLVTEIGPGSDRHSTPKQPCIRLKAVKP